MVKYDIFTWLDINDQAVSKYDSFCMSCKKKISFKVTNHARPQWTYLCGCGCRIITKHDSDEFHKKKYYLVRFIPVKKYIKGFNKMDLPEQEGFKLKDIQGKKVFEK
jgi:hypothetical protein